MMQKDNNNAISEKLSQNDADVVTKRQASEIEERAAFIEVYDYAKSIGAI